MNDTRLNGTNQIVREAMKAASNQVREPQFVRQEGATTTINTTTTARPKEAGSS